MEILQGMRDMLHETREKGKGEKAKAQREGKSKKAKVRGKPAFNKKRLPPHFCL
jgi:hypothetical protein